MKITAVRTAALTVPLEKPTKISTRFLSGRDYVLAWIETADGPTGLGYTYADTSTATLIHDHLREVVVGRDPMSVSAIWG